MNRHKPAFAREAGSQATARMERRSKRRVAKHLVARGLRKRRGLARLVLSGGAVAALATAATLFEAALW